MKLYRAIYRSTSTGAHFSGSDLFQSVEALKARHDAILAMHDGWETALVKSGAKDVAEPYEHDLVGFEQIDSYPVDL